MRLSAPALGVASVFTFATDLGFAVVEADLPLGLDEMTDGETIWYRWHRDPAERALRVLHGLAHCLLVIDRQPHTEGDAWVLTLAMVGHDETRAPAWLFEFIYDALMVA